MKRKLFVPLSVAAAVTMACAVFQAEFVAAEFNHGAARD